MVKKSDIIFLTGIFALGLVLFVFNTARETTADTVRVVSGGGDFGVYSLYEDREIIIGGGNELNVIVIEAGEVKMKEADCFNGDCLRQRPASKGGQSIVCLPNKVVVQIEGTKTDEPDSIAY